MEESASFWDGISAMINTVFGPALKAIFDPINSAMAQVYMPWALIVALGFFFGPMIWVFSLKREYVNVDAPSNKVWYDLRFWTVLSMVPHVIVYFYF